jgi:glutathione synthase/RimK-type ligase-like ATP-grasp enzyme
LRFSEFRAWLDRLDDARVPVWNSTAIVRWNADKHYLLDLQRRGVPTLPTVVVERGRAAADAVDAIAAERAWTRLVVKPVVSASGYETHALAAPLDAAGRALVARVAAAGDVLVQPFIDEIPAHGELSFTFLNGVASHGALKRAAPGEFRVQVEHGGTAVPAMPAPELAAQAGRVLNALPETPLYARVDGVPIDGRFVLMELELIEPNLFLSFERDAATRLALALKRRLETA